MKEIKSSLNKQRQILYSWIRRVDVSVEDVSSISIYKFHAIILKVPGRLGTSLVVLDIMWRVKRPDMWSHNSVRKSTLVGWIGGGRSC